MNKEKILVARATFDDILDRLDAYFDVERNLEDRPFSPEQLGARIDGKVGALLMGGERIDEALLAANPQLRAVCNCAAGFNNFDLEAITRRGVIATNTPHVSNESVADLAWALMMAAARRLREADDYVRSGQWHGFAYDLMIGADLHGRTLGIAGMGGIGQAIARRAAGFGMRVVYHNRRPVPQSIEEACRATWCSKDALLAEVDHLVLTLPYAEETKHFIGAAELRAMKPGATLVNVARGGIVDDRSLAQALHEGRLGGAALDVFENEPRVHPELLTAPRLIMSPHIGSASVPARRALANLAVDNLIAALGYGEQAGNPPSILNPEVLAATTA
ncbi:D-glycerate dehydrogenase [Variovorax sp. KK3]|uniref:2-hydroxyacid dehydrogenase n=1 Tax=Variovorax sp. KK3 TaxID=1855728 RepID=UPI00097C95C1|nr:D-glycerate dehydrogenase [Variovorax sp. KK3]